MKQEHINNFNRVICFLKQLPDIKFTFEANANYDRKTSKNYLAFFDKDGKIKKACVFGWMSEILPELVDKHELAFDRSEELFGINKKTSYTLCSICR